MRSRHAYFYLLQRPHGFILSHTDKPIDRFQIVILRRRRYFTSQLPAHQKIAWRIGLGLPRRVLVSGDEQGMLDLLSSLERPSVDLSAASYTGAADEGGHRALALT